MSANDVVISRVKGNGDVAQFCDLQILKENLLKRTYDERLVDEAINKVIERNKHMGIK